VKLKPRVLCIDDDPGIGVLMSRLFEETGRFHFTFETEPFGAVGLARKFRPDLLILDINMPGQTGIQVASHLRSEPWLRYRPIVLFTALPTLEIPTVLQLADDLVRMAIEFLAEEAKLC
jgi:CheY-like chemotaxis protein